MTQGNIKTKAQGFTIVELLVVIVVIGILAAITIVSYTGITAKANTTKALSNAQSAQNVGEIYFADQGKYPILTTDFSAGTTAKLPTGVTIALGQAGTIASPTGTEPLTLLTAANKAVTVTYACSGGTASAGACTGATGGKITYWDFSTSAVSTNVLYLGAATSASTFFTPAS